MLSSKAIDEGKEGVIPAKDSLWGWPELCRALSLEVVEGPNISGVSIDSRSLAPGELFVALAGDPGPRFQATVISTRDGHEFLDDAAMRGAAGVLISRPDAMAEGREGYALPCLRVDDTMDGLWALGRAGRARCKGRVIAVTGSSGKTTLKTLLANGLGAYASAGTFNNHLGVPLTLARMPAITAIAVVEIGTNHPGEIAPLVSLALPQIAVLLNVLPAHLGNFAGIDALRAEKLAIATALPPEGVFILPAEIATHSQWTGRSITFGAQDADVMVRSQGASATISYGAEQWHIQVPGGGEHRALSCAAACAVAIALEVPMAPFLARMSLTELPSGRGNRIDVHGIVVFDDSYNANPVSMRFALEALAAEPARRRVALLGDMLELGADEGALHAGVASACAGIDAVVCAGPRMASLYQRLPTAQQAGYFADAATLEPEAFAAMLNSGDVVVVKGSKMTFWARQFVARLVVALSQRTS